MHPQGCEDRMDKFPVTLECAAQDLEENELASSTEDVPPYGIGPSEMNGVPNRSVTITEIMENGQIPVAGPSYVRVPNFSTMANFSNGFTFPSPSVAANTLSGSMSLPCMPFSPASSNGVMQFSPAVSTATFSTIQFPTPPTSCYTPTASCSSSSSYCVSSRVNAPNTWQPPAWFQGSVQPMNTIPMSGMPSSMHRPHHAYMGSQGATSRPFAVKGKKKSLKPATSMCTSIHGKRKAEEEEDPILSKKVHVNEDRMAARMQELHLDNNNLEWHPNLEEEPWYSRASDSRASGSVPTIDVDAVEEDAEESDASDVEQELSKINGLPCLELSKELQLGLKTKELLPKVILEQLSKPTMQLVLWKPPGDFVKEVVEDTLGTVSGSARQATNSYTQVEESTSIELEDIGASSSGDMDLDAPGSSFQPAFQQSGLLPGPQGFSAVHVEPGCQQSQLFDSLDNDMDL